MEVRVRGGDRDGCYGDGLRSEWWRWIEERISEKREGEMGTKRKGIEHELT